MVALWDDKLAIQGAVARTDLDKQLTDAEQKEEYLKTVEEDIHEQ